MSAVTLYWASSGVVDPATYLQLDIWDWSTAASQPIGSILFGSAPVSPPAVTALREQIYSYTGSHNLVEPGLQELIIEVDLPVTAGAAYLLQVNANGSIALDTAPMIDTTDRLWTGLQNGQWLPFTPGNCSYGAAIRSDISFDEAALPPPNTHLKLPPPSAPFPPPPCRNIYVAEPDSASMMFVGLLAAIFASVGWCRRLRRFKEGTIGPFVQPPNTQDQAPNFGGPTPVCVHVYQLAKSACSVRKTISRSFSP